MGRKIPGRKHRGVKDPEKQKAERFAKIKDKINAVPSNPDDQQIPKSLSRLIELKDKVKQGLFDKKKKKENRERNAIKPKPFKGRPEKPTPKFEQSSGETDREFKRRMNKICMEVIRESAFEDKYNIDVKRNEDGEVEGVVKRPKDELEVLVKKLQKEKKSKGKTKKATKDGEQQPRLTKSQKWALKKSEKRRKKEIEKNEDFKFMPQKEQFKFGETAHAPPTLIAPKKVEKVGGASRPGRKQLLLKSMLNDDPSQENSKNIVKKSGHKNDSISDLSKTIDKKGKRKSLPNALRRQLDKQQREIIEAYKMLKNKK